MDLLVLVLHRVLAVTKQGEKSREVNVIIRQLTELIRPFNVNVR